MLDMALNAVKFFRNESCGKCVPCRMGSQKMVDILTGWTHGKGTAADLDVDGRTDRSAEADLDLRPGPVRARAASLPCCSIFATRSRRTSVQKQCPEGVCPMHEERMV